MQGEVDCDEKNEDKAVSLWSHILWPYLEAGKEGNQTMVPFYALDSSPTKAQVSMLPNSFYLISKLVLASFKARLIY